MIAMFFKFSIAFSVSFLILSFRINDKPIFNHVSEFTGPLGSEVQNSLKKSVKKSFGKTKKIGRDLFENATPKYLDHIGSKQSSVNKKRELILEDLKRDEVKKLDDLIRKN